MPDAVAMIATGTAIRIDFHSASVHTGLSKNASNQRSENRCGGHVRKKSDVSEIGKMIRIGTSRKSAMSAASAFSAIPVPPSAERSASRSASWPPIRACPPAPGRG